MKLTGTIERRLLLSYRVDPEVLTPLLPRRFRLQLVEGYGVAGICLMRLGSVRPAWAPSAFGVPSSENAAHRIAVEWNDETGVRTGVWIPQRHTSSRLSAAMGGRVFPGELRPASFRVQETPADLHVAFDSADGATSVDVRVEVTPTLESSALFHDAAASSDFFERGSVGWSGDRDLDRWDGFALTTKAWAVDPCRIVHARSSFFDALPAGSAELDSAVVMREVAMRMDPLPALV